MKRIIFLVIFLCSHTLFAQEENSTVKVHALKNFPPQFMLDQNDKPIGFAIDVIEEVAKTPDLT